MIAPPHIVSNVSYRVWPSRYAAPRLSLSVPNMVHGAKWVQIAQGLHEAQTHAGEPKMGLAAIFRGMVLSEGEGTRRFVDEKGNEVRLTSDQFRHILRRHPEMAFQMHRFSETLAKPDAVAPSRSRLGVRLYYRLYPDLRGRNRYVCIVVKKDTGYSFILDAYLDRRIKGE